MKILGIGSLGIFSGGAGVASASTREYNTELFHSVTNQGNSILEVQIRDSQVLKEMQGFEGEVPVDELILISEGTVVDTRSVTTVSNKYRFNASSGEYRIVAKGRGTSKSPQREFSTYEVVAELEVTSNSASVTDVEPVRNNVSDDSSFW